MTEQIDPGQPLLALSKHVVAVYENLGAEHKALSREATETSARERGQILGRMADGIREAGTKCQGVVFSLAAAYGMTLFGVDHLMSKDEEGRDYSPLTMLGTSAEALDEVAEEVLEVAKALGKVYRPTKKYPHLARARRPEHVRTALSSLRALAVGLDAELVARGSGDAEGTQLYVTYVTELEHHLFGVPAQPASLVSSKDVEKAILSSPEVAQAAMAALQQRQAAFPKAIL
ncbi:hypothetical protein [Streptomyces sp. NPDC004286]|uniref:hypothetical protein n=1 Tax=Streptomyces sp. NPDC004286 TaxID=3364696 RepID=UPI0036AEFF32